MKKNVISIRNLCPRGIDLIMSKYIFLSILICIGIVIQLHTGEFMTPFLESQQLKLLANLFSKSLNIVRVFAIHLNIAMFIAETLKHGIYWLPNIYRVIKICYLLLGTAFQIYTKAESYVRKFRNFFLFCFAQEIAVVVLKLVAMTLWRMLWQV